MDNGKLPTVAIVGRPNVGKSALFNRIVGRRIAIVHEESGVTRDRVTAPVHRNGQDFLLVDTGGLGVGVRNKKVELFDGLIRAQVADIVKEAEAIIWVADSQAGFTPQDKEIAEFLKQAGKPVVFAVNKADNLELKDVGMAEFSQAGFDQMHATSCTQNSGINELLGTLLQHIPRVAAEAQTTKPLQVAVVGRPNVGKSSLVNRIFGSERVIVSDIAGTTRDAIDVPVTLRDGDEEIPVTLIDTAGLRRRRQVDSVVEFFSVNRAEKAIRRSDVVLFIMDASDPGTAQDRRIARMIVDEGKPCIALVNKWDLVSGGMKQKDLCELVRGKVPFIKHAPMHTICATSGYNLSGIFDHLISVREQMRVIVPTSVLNQFVQDIMARTPPAAQGTKRMKILYGTMTGNPPPTFLFFVNNRKACPANYVQFLENQLREAFFPEAGLPIRIQFRERRNTQTQDGARRAIAGIMKRKLDKKQAGARHNQRRKGWRKR